MQLPTHQRFLYSCLGGVCFTFVGSCSVLLDFDESIVTPADSGTVDAASSADSTQPDARNCAILDPSDLEPNDVPLEATPLVDMIDSVICSTSTRRDVDVFSFSVSGLDDVFIGLQPSAIATGNLDIRLLNDAAVVIGQATNSDATSIEKLSFTAANLNVLPLGSYFLEVFPDTAETTETYTVSLVIGAAK